MMKDVSSSARRTSPPARSSLCLRRVHGSKYINKNGPLYCEMGKKEQVPKLWMSSRRLRTWPRLAWMERLQGCGDNVHEEADEESSRR